MADKWDEKDLMRFLPIASETWKSLDNCMDGGEQIRVIATALRAAHEEGYRAGLCQRIPETEEEAAELADNGRNTGGRSYR